MQTLLISLLLATAAADTGEQRVYVLGSSINLRKEPSTEAEILEKLQIGTECRVTEKLEGQWLKVLCGEKGGYASASMLGPEKPSAEKLAAEARDTKLPLKQREESALRAATLSPEDTELQKLLGNLFFERNLELAAGIKKPAVRRTFQYTCFNQSDSSCIAVAAGAGVKDVKSRADIKGNLFVVAFGNAERVVVYRGKYQLDKKTQVLKGEVLDQAGFSTTPVMEKALFFGIEMGRSDRWDLALGQFVLDEASYAFLDELPREWAVLERSTSGLWKAQWDDCLKRPYLLKFVPDIHGRWLLIIENVGMDAGIKSRWISAVSKRGSELELTLEEDAVGTTREVFKLPEGRGDIGYLGDKAYSFKLNRYPEVHHACIQGGP
ncbi:SH3 domain-containing protein [Archangium lansingense]|uniref:SH3 domain-containing protein n=1 Tax=Archangium lansingense TaxID=2995310 RepID=A0ABT4AKU4_9BACT|nr:SH3 domain-containing protein [Archangium lansinium]MCY1082318.1 SH3 domain-containing protein [Archangium lansinium]